MRDILIFGLGVIVGAGGLYALFALYQWIGSLSRRVERLRWELSHYNQEKELWGEFHDWKRMPK
jgi:hypothetical protein